MNAKSLLTILGLLLLTLPATATTFYVNVSNTVPVAPYTNWPTAATNIQDAVDVSTDGDLVLVTNGVYAAGGRVLFGLLTNRLVISKAVTVRSANGPTTTFIRGNPTLGNSAVRCVYLGSGATLSGLTLTNGGTMNSGDQYLDQSGGGLYATNNTVVVSNCFFVRNSAYQFGGGAYNGFIQNCSVVQNNAYNGGGLASSLATNCLVLSNTATANGGGAHSATMKNSKLIQNSAVLGGGTYFCSHFGCLMVSNQGFNLGGAIYNAQSVYSCTIIGNSALQGSGGINSSTFVYDSIIYSNTVSVGSTPNYSGVSLAYNCCTTPLPSGGGGNITNNPGFVDFSGGDFHLSQNSPCINSQDTVASIAADLDGNPRIVDGFLDIGAYEYQSANLILPFVIARQYGLSTDGSIDSDGDGMNNWQEAYAGTNPTNAQSVFAITSISNSISGSVLKWSIANGRKYFVQRSTNLAEQTTFSTIRTNLSVIGGTSTTYTDATATNGGSYFYRVGVQ